jgi:hypothetical protein
MSVTRRHDAIALSLLALLITLFFADVLLGINSFYLRDISQFHYPSKKILRDIVLGGEFPYWNPWISAGQPLAANPQNEIFYPLTWLILLPSFLAGFHLLILAHLYIAAFAMYALLRSMQVRAPAAFFGAMSFALGGIVLSYMNLLPFLFSVAWMPLTLLFGRRVLRVGSRRDFAFAGFFLALQLVIGEPTTVIQTGILLGLYALSARPILRRLGQVALISVVALLLSAVQILPALDHVRDSVRAHGFPFDIVSLWSMPPARLAELVYPAVLGNVTAEGLAPYWGKGIYAPRTESYLLNIYSGLLLTVLAAAGLLLRQRGTRLVFSILLVSILCALGSHTPLLELLYDSGFARSIRYPEKFILMGVFALIVFGARMLDGLLEGDDRLRRTAMGVAAAVTIVAGAAWLFTHTGAYGPFFRDFWRLSALPDLETVLASRRGWLIALGSGGLLLVLLRNVARIRRPLWLALAGIFTILDLAPLIPQLAPRLPSSFYRQPPASTQRFPPNRGDFRIFNYADWTRMHDDVRLFQVVDPDSYWRLHNALFPMVPAAYGLRTVIDVDYDLTSLQPTADFTRAVWAISERRPRDWIRGVAAMSNVWYVGIFERPEVAVAKANGKTKDVQPVRFVEGTHHPRYSFAGQLAHVAGYDDFVAKVASGQYPATVALIPGAPFQPAPGIVRHWREWTNGARIDVEAAGRAFLVMSVTPHKYWRITIDGRETPAIVTNLAYQGVVVPPGRHVVEMRYRNPLVPAGAAISIVTLLWSAAALLPLSITRQKR